MILPYNSVHAQKTQNDQLRRIISYLYSHIIISICWILSNYSLSSKVKLIVLFNTRDAFLWLTIIWYLSFTYQSLSTLFSILSLPIFLFDYLFVCRKHTKFYNCLKTCYICLSKSRLFHLMQFFLLPSMLLYCLNMYSW